MLPCVTALLGLFDQLRESGQAGSTFDESVLAKVAALREASPDRRIGIDGGVQRRHAGPSAAAGASWLVVGTDLISPGGAERWGDVVRAGRRG